MKGADTMKRELLTFALVSCLTFGFAACSDDNDKSSDEKPSQDQGNNNENGNGSIEEGAECDASNFSGFCEDAVAVKGCSEDGKYVKEDCSQNAQGKTECFQGACMLPSGSDVECSLDKDCTDEAKPYCYDHQCVAEKPSGKDPCADVTCTSGKCEWGLCLDDMKKEGASCDSPNDAYCIGDVMYYCGQVSETEGAITAYDCAAAGAGTCVRADLGSRGIQVECSGNADMIARCEASAHAEINMCYGTENYHGKFICVDDLKGNAAAMYIGPVGADCTKNADAPVCGYDSSGAPECQAAPSAE